MPLNLIQGPPNSGRAGAVRRRFAAVAERDPILVVPTLDDVFLSLTGQSMTEPSTLDKVPAGRSR